MDTTDHLAGLHASDQETYVKIFAAFPEERALINELVAVYDSCVAALRLALTDNAHFVAFNFYLRNGTQAFVRDRTLTAGETRMRAYFIDNGMAFDGSSWQLREAVAHGLYMDRKVYDLVDMPAICNQTVSQIESFGEGQFFWSVATLPECWLSGHDRDELNRLLMNLHRKRLELRRIVTNQLASMRTRSSDDNESGILRKRMGSVHYRVAARNAGYGS